MKKIYHTKSEAESRYFTAATLFIEDSLVFSQRKSGRIEFFGSADKGFNFSSNGKFRKKMKTILLRYNISDEEINHYIMSATGLSHIDRQMIHTALDLSGILIKKMHQIHYQDSYGIQQFFYLITDAEYIVDKSIGLTFPLILLDELRGLNDELLLNKKKILNPFFDVQVKKIYIPEIKRGNEKDCFGGNFQESHIAALEKAIIFCER